MNSTLFTLRFSFLMLFILALGTMEELYAQPFGETVTLGVCDDRMTTDSADDWYEVTLNITNDNDPGGSWSIQSVSPTEDGFSGSGTYGVDEVFEFINPGTTYMVTIQDNNDFAITHTFEVTTPDACSPECTIVVVITEGGPTANGFKPYDISITGSGTMGIDGQDWYVKLKTGSDGTPPPDPNGDPDTDILETGNGDADITVLVPTNSGEPETLWVFWHNFTDCIHDEALGTVEDDPAVITEIVTIGACDNRMTTDSDDDWYEVTLNITNSSASPGDTWSIDEVSPSEPGFSGNGTYGVDEVFEFINPGTTYMVTIQDNNDTSIKYTFEVTTPEACSPECTLTVNVEEAGPPSNGVQLYTITIGGSGTMGVDGQDWYVKLKTGSDGTPPDPDDPNADILAIGNGNTMPSITVEVPTNSGEPETLWIFWHDFNDCLIDVALGPVVPVELVDFSAAYMQNGIELNWTTISEINSNYFQVERSIDGKTFESIGKLMAQGSSVEGTNYKFMDTQASLAKDYYYRLQMVDLDGQLEYSEIVYVSGKENKDISIYPTVVNESLIVEYTAEEAELTIFNSTGTVVRTFKNENRLDLSDLQAGVYFLIANIEGSRYSKRFTKL